METEKFTGFADFIDQGVPDKYDVNYTGTQFNYKPQSRWTDDDSPGFGSSYGDYETTIIPGNTFDFPIIQYGPDLATRIGPDALGIVVYEGMTF